MSSRPASQRLPRRGGAHLEPAAPNDAHRSWRRRGVGTPSTIAKPTTETLLEIGGLRLGGPRHAGPTPGPGLGGHRGGAYRPSAVLTGGSLLVGSAGRTDLLGADAAEGLDSRAVRGRSSTRPTARGRGRAADPRSWRLCSAGPIDGGRFVGDRRRTPDEPAAALRRVGVPRRCSRRPGRLSDVLRGDGADQPRGAGRAGPPAPPRTLDAAGFGGRSPPALTSSTAGRARSSRRAICPDRSAHRAQ